LSLPFFIVVFVFLLAVKSVVVVGVGLKSPQLVCVVLVVSAAECSVVFVLFPLLSSGWLSCCSCYFVLLFYVAFGCAGGTGCVVTLAVVVVGVFILLHEFDIRESGNREIGKNGSRKKQL
jgi:hypothetical protein